MLGHIVFIAELFKKKMLSSKVIYWIIKRLLTVDENKPRIDDIEVLCKLVIHVGKDIDRPESKPLVDSFMNKIKILSRSPSLPTRIIFMLFDVIEFRARGWSPPRLQ